MPRVFPRDPRNLAVFAVSVLCALVAVLGSAVAERAPLPDQIAHKQALPPAPVRHETKFRRLPDAGLQIRAVEYDGSTNGSLTVQVKNPHKSAHTFTARGLYFVPEGAPDEAPQRLGAVGPMQLAGAAAGQGTEVTALEIAPGQTVEVRLDVFCIDSHRSSPSSENVFNVGRKRLPRALAQTIERRADSAVAKEREAGAAAPIAAAKNKIQSEVWRSRDAKWVELDGEGKQEATKSQPAREPTRDNRRPITR